MKNKLRSRNSSEIYSSQRKKEDKETFWVYYVTRPISFWITPVFLKLGASANQATFLGIAIGIGAVGLIISGSYWWILAGAILMQLWLIMDSVDGNIARYRKTSSLFGKFLEQVNGTIMSALFFSSIGVASSKMPGFLPFSFNISAYWFIVLGILTSFSVIFRHLITCHYQILFFSDREFKPEHWYETSSISLVYNLAIKFLGIYSLAQPLLILAIVFNLLGLYTIIYFLMQVTAIFVNIGFVIIKAKSYK